MGSHNHASSDRSRTSWTSSMERFFIDLMLDQVRKGNRMGHTFNKHAWNDMLISLNENFGSLYDVNVLKSRYANLWKQFNDIKTLLDQSGFSWDNARKMVVAEKCAWDAYTKAHPDAQFFRNKDLTNFDDLCLIYAHTIADGRYSLSSHDVDLDDDIPPLNAAVQANCLVTATKEQPQTDWTLAMDRYFTKLMLDQLKQGNGVNGTFTRQAWKDILIFFISKFGTQCSQKTLKLRHKKLHKYYADLRSILEEKGFFWDEKEQRIVADDVVWDSYIKAHPDARCYRKKPLLSYHNLELLYGNAMSNGLHQQLYERKFFEDDVLQFNTGEEKKRDSLIGDGYMVHSEDADTEDPDLLIDEEEIQSDANGDGLSTDWTPSMDRCLIDIMLEQVGRLNKIDYSTDDQAWMDMVALLKDRFGLQHDKDILKSQSRRLEKQYLDMKNLLSHRGFWWDEVQQMVTACNDVWEAYIEEHPGAESYRTKSKPNYNDLCLIYGKSTANGRGNQSGQYFSCNGGGPKLTNGYHWRTDWTPPMDRYFINLMLEQVRNGSMLNQKFSKLAWTDIVAKFSADFGLQYEKDVLKSRFLNLRKRFNDMKALVEQSGFAWDEMQQRIIADDDLWDACVKEYPDTRSYRNRTLPNFNDLYLIFGDANAIEKQSYSSCSMDTENDDPEVNIGEEEDQSPADFYPPTEHPDAIPYGDGLMDGYDDLFASLSYEVPNGRSNFCIESETEVGNVQQTGMNDIFRDLQSPAREFELSKQRKKRKSTGSLRPAGGKKVQRKIKETEERFKEKSGLLNWLADGEEENGYCSIERVVGALETVPDMTDELFLEACELLEDERKAKMFVAMDVTARKNWLLRKLRR